MKKSEFKKIVKEYFSKNYTNDRIVDISVWNDKIWNEDSWFYQIITISKNHNASRFTGWLNDDKKTLTVKYEGCL